MKIALLQTKQNALYDFDGSRQVLSHEEAFALQKEMVEQCFCLGEQAIGQQCDLIVTSEALNFCGQEDILPKPYSSYIPLYPGDGLFIRLSELAKDAESWLVAGVYNKRRDEDGRLRCYNSAFIYNRAGELVDIYDKVHLTETESDNLTSGARYVTIDTDMGKMGVAICYDMQFPDVCMKCREMGAEFMAVPTWGWEHGYGMQRVRETGQGFAVAMAVPYRISIMEPRYPSELIDRSGCILASAQCREAEVLTGYLP